jgi:hypothetical protein
MRPLGRRGSWDVVEERVVRDNSSERLSYREMVRVAVTTDSKGRKCLDLIPSTDKDKVLVDQIKAQIRRYYGLLTATDMSYWILSMLSSYASAISLRPRGGFYFVPRDRVERWQRVVRCVRAVSQHKIYQIPAVQSEEAVEAILEAFRREVTTAMGELEEYLQGDVSTRGLNAWERDLGKLQEKTAHYARLLGVALPDLEGKAVTLKGALKVAQIKNQAEKEKARSVAA